MGNARIPKEKGDNMNWIAYLAIAPITAIAFRYRKKIKCALGFHALNLIGQAYKADKTADHMVLCDVYQCSKCGAMPWKSHIEKEEKPINKGGLPDASEYEFL